MNNQLRSIVVGVVILLCFSAFTFGALTASPSTETKTTPTPIKTVSSKPKPTKQPVTLTVESELPIITNILIAAYPKIATDYDLTNAKLYEHGKWFGAILRYKGADTANRDTLRVLLERKGDEWILRTKPPVIILSSKHLSDVPKSVLQDINKPVGLP